MEESALHKDQANLDSERRLHHAGFVKSTPESVLDIGSALPGDLLIRLDLSSLFLRTSNGEWAFIGGASSLSGPVETTTHGIPVWNGTTGGTLIDTPTTIDPLTGSLLLPAAAYIEVAKISTPDTPATGFERIFANASGVLSVLKEDGSTVSLEGVDGADPYGFTMYEDTIPTWSTTQHKFIKAFNTLAYTETNQTLGCLNGQTVFKGIFFGSQGLGVSLRGSSTTIDQDLTNLNGTRGTVKVDTNGDIIISAGNPAYDGNPGSVYIDTVNNGDLHVETGNGSVSFKRNTSSTFTLQAWGSGQELLVSSGSRINANGQVLTGLPTPTTDPEAATKGYVDALLQGLDWQQSVLDYTATPPGLPATGDRYLLASGATGAWSGQDGKIAVWGGSSWSFITPNKGFAVWVENLAKQYNYNGTNWVPFGSTTDHGSLTGLGDDDHTQYLTTGRADTWLGTKTTSSLAEGSNLYYTTARVQSDVASFLVAGTGITLTAGTGTLTASVSDNTTNQKVRIYKSGTLIGTRRSVNLIEGSNVTLTVSDNSGSDRVDVTVAATVPAAGLPDPGGNGFVVRTALNTTTNRTLTGTLNRLTVTNGDGQAGSPTFDISSSYEGQSSINTVGTLTGGTWTATAIAANYGGTGLTTYVVGDLLYATSATTLGRLVAVAAGKVLVSNGAASPPLWGQADLSAAVTGTLPVANGGTGTSTAFTPGSIPFAGTSGIYSQDNTRLFWDSTNYRMRIGTAAFPDTPLGALNIYQSTDAYGLTIQAPNISGQIGFLLYNIPVASSATTGKAFGFQCSGETSARGMFYSTGAYGIGSGAATRDTFIMRSAASTLTIAGSFDGATAGHLVVSGSSTLGSYLSLANQASAPTQVASHVLIYSKSSDGNLYAKTAAGTEYQLTPTNSGIVAIASGGTGQTTAAAAFDALAPTTTKGDLIVHTSSTNARVQVGSNGKVLTADSTSTAGVSWVTPKNIHTFEASNLGSASETASLLYKAGYGVTNALPTGSPYTYWGSGGVDPYLAVEAMTITKAMVTVQTACVSQGTVGATATLRIDVYQEDYSSRTLLGSIDFSMNTAKIQTNNTLSATNNSQSVEATGLSISIPAGTRFSLQFTNRSADNTQINGVARCICRVFAEA